LPSTVFTLDETEQAIITQFGEPVGDAITNAGLHVKVPFIQQSASLRQALAGLGRGRQSNHH
jgi:membrane protease subunit HflC